MNLTVAASVALAGLLTSPFLSAAPQEEVKPLPRQVDGIPESLVGLSIFVPEQIGARDLLRYSKEMTERGFIVALKSGGSAKRDYFIDMGEGIGIQGTEEDRVRLMKLLEGLDERIGAVRTADQKKSKNEIRTLRLKFLSCDSAVTLIGRLGLPVNVASVQENGSLVLQGSSSSLDQLERVLGEADIRLPQLTMHCEILEAVTLDDSGRTPSHSAYRKAPELLTGDVAKALEAINPGKKFARRAHLLLRSSIGGQRPIEISSAIAQSFNVDAQSPVDPRLVFSCIPTGWDPETKALSLDQCSVRLEVPTFQVMTTGNGEKTKQFTGYTEQGINSRLSLKAGETTVVGSLGGDPVYVALRFSVR